MANDDGEDDENLLGGEMYATALEGPALEPRASLAEGPGTPSLFLRQAGVGGEAGKLEGLLVPVQEHDSQQQHHQERHAGLRPHLNDQDACKLCHLLVGVPSTPASGKQNKALKIFQGYESTKGAWANDGFAALHAIIKTYGQRHESDAMRVDDELRTAM
mmetsp:Transcript_11165/g.17946  ORF Transcript_11165/g.17946 Transcript_11165/m.17946 type:complete len:160 (+) Transcript_11165:738-1217(+)